MDDKTTLGDLEISMDGNIRDLESYFLALDTLLAMYGRSVEDERKVVLRSLVTQLAGDDPIKAELNGLNVSILLIPGVRSITSVNRGDIGMDTAPEPLD